MITFGTSGWRGIIAEDFTFAGVRAVARAIAEHLLGPASRVPGPGSPDSGPATRDPRPEVVVGYDTRFQSEAFAAECVKVLAAAGLRSHLVGRPTPTPVLAHAIRALGAAGGINITASHNPPEWNGLKYSAETGGPALPAATDAIARRANAILSAGSGGELQVPTRSLTEAEAAGLVRPLDPAPPYCAQLRRLVDCETIRHAGREAGGPGGRQARREGGHPAGLRVAVDLLHGTAGGYLDVLLREAGCDVEVLHADRNPGFGGHPPEPAAEHLGLLAARVREGGRHLGLACDGDADRFGILDGDGTFLEPNAVLALIAAHLFKARDWPGGVARSVATTHLLDRVAARYGRPVVETPVGFKYIGELIARDAIVLGGEESAGLSVRGHVPEKDGILACLLVAELVAANGRRPLRQLLQQLFAEVGTLLTRRINVPLGGGGGAALDARLRALPSHVAGRKVVGVNRTDGVKLLLDDGSWLLVRPSGTEPLARLYLEADSDAALAALESAGRALLP